MYVHHANPDRYLASYALVAICLLLLPSTPGSPYITLRPNESAPLVQLLPYTPPTPYTLHTRSTGKTSPPTPKTSWTNCLWWTTRSACQPPRRWGIPGSPPWRPPVATRTYTAPSRVTCWLAALWVPRRVQESWETPAAYAVAEGVAAEAVVAALVVIEAPRPAEQGDVVCSRRTSTNCSAIPSWRQNCPPCPLATRRPEVPLLRCKECRGGVGEV